MCVRIDAARDHEFAGSIDNVVGLHLKATSDDGDAFILDQNVGPIIIDGGHDATVLNKSFHASPETSTDYTDRNGSMQSA